MVKAGPCPLANPIQLAATMQINASQPCHHRLLLFKLDIGVFVNDKILLLPK
jgi:hypothetical protein